MHLLEALSSKLTGKIDDYWDETWNLPPNFSTIFPDIAQEINNFTLDTPNSDKLVRTLTKNGEILSKAIFEAITDNPGIKPWCKFIWKRFIPPRRSIHVRKTLLKKLPSDDNLKKRGFLFPRKCRLCNRIEETLTHVFVDCSFSKTLLNKIEDIFGKKINLTSNFNSLFQEAMKEKFSPQIFSLWQCAIISNCWIIWNCRNKKIFEEASPNINAAKALLIVFLREANNLIKGSMRNSMEDLITLHNLGIKGNPPKSPITQVTWNPPPTN